MTRPDYFIISQLDLNFELLNPVIKFCYETHKLITFLAIWAKEKISKKEVMTRKKFGKETFPYFLFCKSDKLYEN